MKKIYLLLSFVMISSSIIAQNKDTQSADKLFNRYEYVSAAEAYLKLVDKGQSSPYVYKQLADSYFYIFNTVEAAKWYAKATEEKQDSETYYRYAQMLKGNGKYEEANRQMQKFASMEPNDQRAIAFKENPNYIPSLLDQSKLFNVKSLDMNSEKSDFGATLHDNTIYFTSARNTAKKVYGWNKEPFLDVYSANYNADGTITDVAAIGELNSQYHDAFGTMSPDGNTLYFTSDSFREHLFEKDKKNKLKLGKNNIFRATKNGTKWGNITSLAFNSKDYSTSNPSLSRDGKTLYFASDMPGSLGGVDIWKATVNADGSLGVPENLGNNVNTEGNESFPFIADDNILYFASSGRPGLGGLDVYKIDLNNPTDAMNIGKPVNSEKDDFSFTFNSSKNTGFFSTNRGGNDDIYGANPLCGLDVMTIVTNARTGEVLAGARVAILDDKKNVIATETSNAKGEVAYKVECEREYTIQAAKDGFESNTFAVDKSGNKSSKKQVNAALQPIDVIVTETEIILKEVYFEFNKSNITQEGAFELDKLVQVMKNNDKLAIIVKAHTDNRGSDNYNMSLSDRRARSTVQYVISKGISKDRISGKGYGESEPKVDCGTTCTEEQHALNRRSEFLIVK